ncbi:EamA family transporter [Methyloversatilis sp.]|uniref:EamA family transporter n=1 Tax=Methyloversatilis sp. TaxID=2569862 RepID=UPI0027337516|nr:EamA family transporter [Methyloversatilis sp.]MDP2868776.1 EamA family transporter [Methyloversatilis sp.]MDP3455584.1 EamA family transporter [Methyloversatilis sp.]MDP3577445.1 EamA family transporter [Methyloversatilis sp.]
MSYLPATPADSVQHCHGANAPDACRVFGVIAVAPFAAWLRGESPLSEIAAIGPETWAVLIILGGVLVVVNLVVQYGITFVAANAAIALFLFELVAAALSSWWLAGEAMGLKEWVGGAMIIAASLFSGHLEPAQVARDASGSDREAISSR